MSVTRNRRQTRQRWLALVVLAATQFVLVLDSAIVNVALPSIERDLQFSPEGLSWVVNAYALAFGGLLLLGGRLADAAGGRRMFVVGLAVFTAASVAGALAQDSAWLVAARGAQGVGAAMIAPAALALVLVLFDAGAARHRALGVFAAAAGLGGASGAILGGVLTEVFGWPAILWINLPIGAAAAALAPRVLPGRSASADSRGFDLAGAVSVTAGLVTLVYALSGTANAGWTSARTVALFAGAAAALVAFVAIEQRTARPLVDLDLFRLPGLRGANVAALLTAMAMMPMWFLLTFYVQRVYGYGPIAAGLAVIPTVVMLVVLNSLSPRVIARFGVKAPMVAGLLIAAVGLAAQSRLSGPDGRYVTDLLAPLLVTGIGFGLTFVAGTVAATAAVPAHRAGLASGVLTTSQQLGGAVGLAVLVSVATTRTTGPDGVTAGISAAFVTAAAFAAVGAALAALLLPRTTSTAAPAPSVSEPAGIDRAAVRESGLAA